MSKHNKPAICVKSGERFIIETKDCYSNKLRSTRDHFTKDMWPSVNPASGPVFIIGAKPGDVVRVDILKIRTRDFAVMCLEHNSGPLGKVIQGVETTILPIRNRRLHIKKNFSLPLRTMLGVIGTAPKGKPVPNGTPGEHGSNMDCKEIIEGTSVYLPVNVPGALLMLGDFHAVMGDGEVCICGAETAGQVTLRAVVLRKQLPTPCIENKHMISFLASAKTLEGCEPLVLEKAHRYLTRNLKMKPNEAARIMSLTGDLQVCQIVDPLKTIRFTLCKNVLKHYGLKGRAI